MTNLSNNNQNSRSLAELLSVLYNNPDNLYPGGASEEEVEELEEELGTALPVGYVQFLKKFGGGNFKNIRLYSVASEDETFHDFMEQVFACNRRIPLVQRGELLPFGDDYEGNIFCFDLHQAREGENVILRWDAEFSEDNEPRHIAHTFAEFLENVELLEEPLLDEQNLSVDNL